MNNFQVTNYLHIFFTQGNNENLNSTTPHPHIHHHNKSRASRTHKNLEFIWLLLIIWPICRKLEMLALEPQEYKMYLEKKQEMVNLRTQKT